MAVTYTRLRGETLIFPIYDPDAAAGDEIRVAAKLAVLKPGSRILEKSVTAAATLTAEFRDATEHVPKGWNLVLSAEACGALDPGFYQLDAARADGAVVEAIREPAIVRLQEPAFT